jgi:LAO/AO transport system kinase
MELVQQALTGSERAIARLITIVENEMDGWMDIMRELYPHTGGGYLIGITGPTGSGKSTLVDFLALALCRKGHSVGIVAIDPSSPFTGGALLGDRIRMREVTSQENVFIRSLGTRGGLGGISRATSDVIKILDAAGKEFILIETIGVGQDEVEIVQVADTSLVVSVPGLGDDIQTIKAGIMEIGDIFVVNKADRDGADHVVTMIKAMLDLSPFSQTWEKPVIKTVATENSGVDELLDSILKHRRHLMESGLLTIKRKERIGREITKLLEQRISQYVHERMERIDFLKDSVEQISNRKEDPYTSVDRLLKELEKQEKP